MTSELEEKEQQERLREAAALGDLQELQKLVQSGVNINSQNEINGWTCLHWACKRNHDKIISYLLDHGADKDIVTNKGETPVDLTSRKHIKKIMGVEENEIEELKEDSELPIVPNYLANPPFPYVYSKKTDSLLDASKISQTENNASSFTSQCVPNASFSSPQTKINFKPLSLHTEERYPAVAHNGNMHAALEPPTVVHNGPVCQSSMPQNQSLFSPVMTPQQQKSEHPGHMASFQPLFFTGAFPFNTQELVLKVRIQNTALGEHDFIEVEMDRQELTYQELLRVCCLELGVHAEQVERIRKLPNTLLRKDKDVARLQNFQELELVLVRSDNNGLFRTSALEGISCYNRKASKLTY